MTFPLLTTLALVPIVGGLLVLFLKGNAGRTAGMALSLVTLGLGLWAFFADGQLTEKHRWISQIGAWYALDLDGMAKAMVLLTVILVPIVLLAEWNVGEQEEGRWGTNVFFGLALVLEGLALYVFMADDALLFYLFFEATLLPMYFLVGGWGGPKRGAAALKFLLYSLAGGLVMLVGVIGLGVASADAGQPSLLMSDLAKLNLDGSLGRWLWVAFFIAFAIKAPMVPVHTWLPDTAEQATPGSSTLLVGILDKIGTFGMIRFCLDLFPEASRWAAPTVMVLALVSIFYGAFMAMATKHLLRFVSYTSISHFGFMVLGIFAFTTTSMNGTMFYMLNHGFSTAALFLAVGYLVKRRGSAMIGDFGGVQSHAPVAASMFLFAGMSACALPFLGSFIGEFMVMTGTWQRHPVHAGISMLGTVMAALYVLLCYQRTMTGPSNEVVESHFVNNDLTAREKLVMIPLIALLVGFGVYSQPMLSVTETTVKDTMTQVGMTDPAPVIKGEK